jgi:hypothetical protein
MVLASIPVIADAASGVFRAELRSRVPGEFAALATATLLGQERGQDRQLFVCEEVGLVKGEVAGKQDVLARVHSECLTGDALGSLRCDCGEQRVVRNNSLRRGHTKSCGCSAGKSNNFQGSHMALPKMLSREFVQYVTDIINTIEQKPEGFQVEFETNQRALTFQQAVYRIRGMVLRKNPADESPITKVGMSRKGNVVHVHPMSVIFATAKIKSKDGRS